ncbi:Serine-tRNA synthetase type1 N-terminal protein [Dioscorea alata]|uniref:Serine-tRNA synthetase type1 N-terminal protein n=4 Tax=Dioscorea alata TaxID=55571 RepID=A0ACB7UGJ3_DIOAL|nr:Serine-tRNA synthetase type1 N-terminal protein [Dioscorea alata]KAH7659410.1 Serine-tRNA synthetase type1 N-terminal protein [Dioscorea alata]
MDGGNVGCSSSHRRSKSAADRISELARHGTSYSMGEDINDYKNLMKSSKSHVTPEVAHRNNICDAALNHRVSLENDIKQLQVNLQQEKSVRVMLEKAIGRASGTLSPGHRHFATQTRELIAEIEFLEEEIANREQHVLSLYRSMLDQCLSTSTSAQSSGRTSPAQTKNGGRKHPSIISSAFCSSRKFPLHSFQVLSTIKESKKGSVFVKPKGKHEQISTTKTSTHGGCNPSDFKLPTFGGSRLARTLKDHLYQCPSKLSEELIRCMAAIYCWLQTDASTDAENGRSPFLSRSSTNVILPRRGAGDEKVLSCRPMVEISSISIDKKKFSSASYAINSYRLLVENLERVDASMLESGAKLAFWLNVYNSLIMHGYLVYGISHTSLRRLALFHKTAYNIGGYVFTANSIEHCILCCHTPRIGRWFETILSNAMRKKSGEEKQLLESKFGLCRSQPLVYFGLCTGAASDPMLRVYTAKNVIDELEKAKKEFLQSNVVVKKSRKVFLPKILERYAKETGLSSGELLTWVLENIDKKLHESADPKNKRKASQVIEWLPYNTRFRYILSTDFAENQ